jgi:hypothetical protein
MDMAERGRRRATRGMQRRHATGQSDPGAAPLDVDGVATIAAGCAAWLIALVVLFVQRAELEADGHMWWLWTCVAGFGLGLLGLQYCLRRRDRMRSAGPSIDE